jgi:hypothetical protein
MQITAEIRWFWKDAVPGLLDSWFRNERRHACRAGGGSTRVDEYVCAQQMCTPEHAELGMKRRDGGGMELKGLVDGRWFSLATAPFSGPVELWCKWQADGIAPGDARLVPVEKQRWMRLFDASTPWPQEVALDAEERPVDPDAAPTRGCRAELTRLILEPEKHSGQVWWTLGLEAFGSLRTLERDLRAVAGVLMARRAPPFSGYASSYPAWLAQILTQPAHR